MIDFGSTAVTGIHVLAVERIHQYFGLDKNPVRVIEPFQMLGEIEPDLQEVLGFDIIGFWGRNNMFGFPNDNWEMLTESYLKRGKTIIANFGGTSLGDIALVPGLDMKYPKGIRDVAEWYMSIIMRSDHIHAVFEKQTDIAVSNLEKNYKIVGNRVDAVEIYGNDFGTQDSLFCSPETFEEMYTPYYRKINDWVHENIYWTKNRGTKDLLTTVS